MVNPGHVLEHVWVRRMGDELSLYGVDSERKIVTRHERVAADGIAERWRELLDEQRRAGYYLVTGDATDVLRLLRHVERESGASLQVSLTTRGERVDVTAACERWAGASTAKKRDLVARLFECYQPRASTVPPIVELACRMLAGEASWVVTERPRLSLTTPLIAELAREGTPAGDGELCGVRYPLPSGAALTIAFMR